MPNSAAALPAFVVGGVFSSPADTLQPGQADAIQLDIKGNVKVSAVGPSGSPAALNNPVPVELSDGTNPVGTSANPLRESSSSETSTIFNGLVALTPLFSPVVASASGATTIVAAVVSKIIRVVAVQLIVNAAVNVKWQSHISPTDITGLAYCAANGGYVLPYNPVGWFQTISGEALDINLSAAVAVGGSITYVTV